MNAVTGVAGLLGDVAEEALHEALRGPGIHLALGALAVRLCSDSPALARQVRSVYRHFPFISEPRWADVHADLMRARGMRRWLRPQVEFRCDGSAPFEPFPADSPLPLLEWGSNWLIGRRLNDLLLLHAGALERDGCALVMPAAPGSGKSTLTAALSLRGWRLLSDEFGAWDPARDAFVAVLKPVALKNRSIDVIRSFQPDAPIGPSFPKTRKGTVAHLAAGVSSVHAVACPARAGAVIFPRWEQGIRTRIVPVGADEIFPALAYNAFNYGLLGEVAYDACVRLARGCPGWRLEYSRLEEAVEAIGELWPQVARRSRESASLPR